MGKISSFLIVMSLLMAPMTVFNGSAHDEDTKQEELDGLTLGDEKKPSAILPMDLPSTIKIWEAWAKGYATIMQSTYGSYTVYNNGPVEIVIDEYVMLMSPSPSNPSEDQPGINDETQDGILTPTNYVSSGSSLTFNYGQYVAEGSQSPPPWWCTEDTEFTNAGIYITLGGEIMPYSLESIVDPYDENTQDDIYYHLDNNPTLVIGKLPLWEEIANTGDEVDITLEITNIGFVDATNIVVRDTVPYGFYYDPSSFTQTPSSINYNPDGTITFEWEIDQIAAGIKVDDTYEDLEIPTIYTTEYISYKLITPALAPDLRIYLPRGYVDKNGDGNDDAESEEPLLETYLSNSPPVAVVNDVQINEGETAILDGSSSYDPDEPSGDYIVSYDWDFTGDGNPDLYGPIVSWPYGDNGVYTVTLTVTDTYGASSSDTATIIVYNLNPTIDPLPDIMINDGDTVNFSAHATDPGSDDLTFRWNWSDGTPIDVSIYYNNGVSPDPYPSPDINPMDIWDTVSHYYPNEGVFLVTLAVMDDDGGLSTVTFTVSVNDLAPAADFSWSPAPQVEGSPVQFTDLSTSSPDIIVSWIWDFGGLGTSTLQNPQFTFMDDGIYTVTLTVTDDDGSQDSVSHNVTILDLTPTANFSWSPEPQDEGSPVQFTDLSFSSPDNITAWDWDFGGLGNSALQNPQFTFMDNGYHTVTLTVTDEDGSTDSISYIVTVLDLAPNADFTWSPEPQEEGSPVVFLDLSTSYPDNITSWDWDFGGLGTSTLQNPQFTFLDDGIYTVTLIVTDDDSSTDTASYNVTILDLAPIANFSWSPEPQDEGSPVTFTDLSTSYPDVIVSWYWEFGDGETSTAQNPSHSYGDNGVYTVTLTVIDDDGSTATISYAVTILNVAPSVYAGSDQITDEGTGISFLGNFSDPGWLDTHTIEWNFGDGTTSSETLTPTHTYGDNGVYNVTLTVTDDDGGVGVDTIVVTVNNVAPSIEPLATYTTDENLAVLLSGLATDPGSDDLTFTWNWGDGTSDTIIIYYNNGVGPDPYPSPEINPMNITDIQAHTYGDNGVFTVTLTVEDDDGGATVVTTTVTVINVAPTIAPLGSYSVDENSLLTLVGHATDPGSDDLTFTWNWGDGTIDSITIHYNDGVGPDPYPSPEINPMNATDSVDHIYGDNGVFTVTLTVEDDDGGVVSVTTTVTVNNVAPSVNFGGPYIVDENTPVTLTAIVEDPGSDDLTLTWEFDYGPTNAETHYNDGLGPDPYPSPEINPMILADSQTHTYGDNGMFLVTLTVEDDDGGINVTTKQVIVNNVAPTILNMEAYMLVNITLRVAGEKYHSVGIHLYENGQEISSAIVTRYPGSPDEQLGTLGLVRIDMTKTYHALINYLPNDPRVNGNVWGGNPVWVNILFEDGTNTRLHHTFNVRQSDWNSDHWNHIDPWEVELTPYIWGHNITFEAHAEDPGSDDLTFYWDFGDSNFSGPNIYYNDMLGADPYPSPEINPINVTDTANHHYGASGTFIVTLTVEDDDGGICVMTLTLTVG